MGTYDSLLMMLELPSTQKETLMYLDPISLSLNSQIISGLEVTWDAAEFLLSPQPPQCDYRPGCGVSQFLISKPEGLRREQ